MQNYNLSILYLFYIVGLLYMIVQIYLYMQRRIVLKELEIREFPAKFEKYLLEIDAYVALNDELKKKVQKKILIFLEDKEFIGIKMQLSDEIKLIISFYASLMRIHEVGFIYKNLKTILVYPYEFIYKEVRSYDGVYTKERYILEGQSTHDSVVISWHSAKKEISHPHSHNVIIHEFAHVLDFEDGSADGIPLIDSMQYSEFSTVLYREFKKLKAKSMKNRYWGKYALLGKYASTNEAEFFAVISELFFVRPESLHKKFPELYHELLEFYKLDTLSLYKDRVFK